MKKLALIILAASAPLLSQAQLTSVTASIRLELDPAQLGGLSTNDYLTNITVVLGSTTNAATATNAYPVVFAVPATSFLPQGPPGTWWTASFLVDSSTRFYLVWTTNQNGIVGPFSQVVPFLWNSPGGRLKVTKTGP